MARKTRQLRELEVVEVLIRQGAIIPCFRCRIAFTVNDVKGKNIENEHLHEHGLGGQDGPDNRAFSHKDPCHNTVTHGNGATFAGSSRHKVKKATDPERINKFVVRKEPPKPRLRPLDADRVSIPSGRCTGCGSAEKEFCTCPSKPRRSGFGRRPAARSKMELT